MQGGTVFNNLAQSESFFEQVKIPPESWNLSFPKLPIPAESHRRFAGDGRLKTDD